MVCAAPTLRGRPRLTTATTMTSAVRERRFRSRFWPVTTRTRSWRPLHALTRRPPVFTGCIPVWANYSGAANYLARERDAPGARLPEGSTFGPILAKTAEKQGFSRGLKLPLRQQHSFQILPIRD